MSSPSLQQLKELIAQEKAMAGYSKRPIYSLDVRLAIKKILGKHSVTEIAKTLEVSESFIRSTQKITPKTGGGDNKQENKADLQFIQMPKAIESQYFSNSHQIMKVTTANGVIIEIFN